MLIQDRGHGQVSRQGAVLGQGMQKGFKTGGCRKTGGRRQGGCCRIDPLSCAKIGATVKKKGGRNTSAQRNHLYIRANFTCLSAQKPQEHAQVRGMGCQKCGATGGGYRLHPVWLHLTLGVANIRAQNCFPTHVAHAHNTEFFLAPKYLAPCQPLVRVILLILLETLSATGLILLRLSGALLPTSEAFSLTDRWGHCTQLWSAVCNHSAEHCFRHRKRFSVRTPGVRCAPYLGTSIQ